MQIAIPLFDRFTALDAVGPYEVLSRLPGARVDFVAAVPGIYRTDTRMLGLSVELSYADAPSPDVLVFPGGFGTRALMHDEPTLEWVRQVHEQSRYTTSVCTGALVLGAAGVLEGLDATTHWMARPLLAGLGARAVESRVVEQGKVITAAGASAGSSRGRKSRRRCSSGSSTTRSRRTTPGRPRRRPRRSLRPCARSSARKRRRSPRRARSGGESFPRPRRLRRSRSRPRRGRRGPGGSSWPGSTHRDARRNAMRPISLRLNRRTRAVRPIACRPR